MGSETDEGVGKTKFLPKLGIDPGTTGPRPRILSTKLSALPIDVTVCVLQRCLAEYHCPGWVQQLL